MNRLVLAVAVAALLSACGSAVKLDNVPVEDKAGAAVSTSSDADSGKADGSAVGKGTVTGLDLGQSGKDTALQATTRIVYFDYDSFAIRPEFQSVIEAHARSIKSDKARKVAIEGHTDERGGREYNLALGQKRAEAVRRALGLLGVAESQLEAVSFGKEKPAVLGATEAAMEKNRRAEISYR
ncbi:MAG: peptidoglycan-associated lipoprotein Pal [Rhodoferax sp.]|nr:peptidoglycan-associated lipoprotein Pal [Rhodoferax sp.]MDP3652768.1 peptidoglycan-associated lipoprotein Pal [Rhodoferax sp.]